MVTWVNKMPLDKKENGLRADRRSHPRYPVAVDLTYELVPEDGAVHANVGRSVNLSSGGLLFDANYPVPEDKQILLSIPWPVTSHNEISNPVRSACSWQNGPDQRETCGCEI